VIVRTDSTRRSKRRASNPLIFTSTAAPPKIAEFARDFGRYQPSKAERLQDWRCGANRACVSQGRQIARL
jgi:hypothetical protein